MAAANKKREQTGDVVREGLSELRTAVLGPQILLGFQYEALFQPGFATLSPLRRELSALTFALLLVTLGLVIAPCGLHQLAERGQRSLRQAGFGNRMLALSLLPFALAIGINLVVAAGGELGQGTALVAGAVAAAVSLGLWYGMEWMMKRSRGAAAPAPGATSLKDRVMDVMTETRIVLPGVQALLGFQFAAYLSDAFAKLPAAARIAHDASLGLLLASMVLLMTPGPFHRLAENGEDTERTCRVGGACIVGALVTLSLGLAADFFVVVEAVTGSLRTAWSCGLVAALATLALWLAYPILTRSRPAARGPQASQHHLSQNA